MSVSNSDQRACQTYPVELDSSAPVFQMTLVPCAFHPLLRCLPKLPGTCLCHEEPTAHCLGRNSSPGRSTILLHSISQGPLQLLIFLFPFHTRQIDQWLRLPRSHSEVCRSRSDVCSVAINRDSFAFER